MPRGTLSSPDSSQRPEPPFSDGTAATGVRRRRLASPSTPRARVPDDYQERPAADRPPRATRGASATRFAEAGAFQPNPVTLPTARTPTRTGQRHERRRLRHPHRRTRPRSGRHQAPPGRSHRRHGPHRRRRRPGSTGDEGGPRRTPGSRGKMDEQDFIQASQRVFSPGYEFDNYIRGTTRILRIDDAAITYRRGKSRIRVDLRDLHMTYDHFRGRRVSCRDLQEFKPAVFDSEARPAGHSCNCTFLFHLLERIGWLVQRKGGDIKEIRSG